MAEDPEETLKKMVANYITVFYGPNALEIGPNTFLGAKFPNCFKGKNLIIKISQNLSLSEKEAFPIAEYFLKNRWITHLSSNLLGFTMACFYRPTDAAPKQKSTPASMTGKPPSNNNSVNNEGEMNSVVWIVPRGQSKNDQDLPPPPPPEKNPDRSETQYSAMPPSVILQRGHGSDVTRETQIYDIGFAGPEARNEVLDSSSDYSDVDLVLRDSSNSTPTRRKSNRETRGTLELIRGDSQSPSRPSLPQTVSLLSSSSSFGHNSPISSTLSIQVQYSDLEFEEGSLTSSLLGKGAFGCVFKGSWRGSEVAIKKCGQELSEEEEAEFITEAFLMGSIRPHPNLVTFFGFCAPPDPVCIILEYLPNNSILSFFQKKVPKGAKLHPLLVLHFCKGISAGMLHLSSEGVVHRDLACRNVLLGKEVRSWSDWNAFVQFETFQKLFGNFGEIKQKEGLPWLVPEGVDLKQFWESQNIKESANFLKDFSGFGVVKVSDFGLSRVVANKEDENKTNTLVGPIRWMSPESLAEQVYSEKTDVWAFGICLYELLTLSLPYDWLDLTQVAIQVASSKLVPRFSPLERKLYPTFVALAEKCTCFNPDQRPTFREIRETLNRKDFLP